jgi:lipid A 3-O-deacylase
VIARALIVSLVIMAAPLGAAISQLAAPPATPAPHTLVVRADNDAFDFWMAPWNRPDDEYTSGVHITYEGGDAPVWARGPLRARAACAIGALVCRTGATEVGQDIYTPLVAVDSPHAAPGSRPNAGWLYIQQQAAALSASSSDELALTLGVTGPPSLARYTQQLAHHAAPQFNRPTDWSRQLAFEPGAIVRYEHRERLLSTDDAADGAPIGVDVIPRYAASIGNVLTNLEGGVQSRIGWRLPHPWLPSAPRPSLALSVGVNGQFVARNLFLDGNSFQSGPRVGHEPFVGSGELGLELRAGRFIAGYRAVSESRAYAGGPKWHPWSSLTAGITLE